jgi:hypothetical protein
VYGAPDLLAPHAGLDLDGISGANLGRVKTADVGDGALQRLHIRSTEGFLGMSDVAPWDHERLQSHLVVLRGQIDECRISVTPHTLDDAACRRDDILPRCGTRALKRCALSGPIESIPVKDSHEVNKGPIGG